MGYRPKKSPFSHLKARNLSYKEDDQTFTLISFNRDSMLLEVHINDGKETKIVTDFPFAHLPKKIKQELNPL
ncbi:hypothetical protein [Sulfuricurvum sp.]|jgi:hypothetical protein|uniref:hypothetical protein n=1 Tax=Sulfuricurvum sp. TaxID=2025608 RepID=UPI00356986E1